MALDPEFVVIGGGLMDPENTTDAFRERYLRIIARDGAPAPVAGSSATGSRSFPSTLGELSQAIGAALVALYRNRR